MQDKTMELLQKYLDGDYVVSPMAPRKTTRQDIAEVEKALQIPLPEEYIAHLLAQQAEVLGERGLYIEVKEEVWPRGKVYDVGPFWSFLYGMHTFTACPESADWMRLAYVGENFMQDTGLKALPILQIIGDANVYCVNEVGKIVQYDHEQNILEACDLTFWELFEQELQNLEQRKERKKQENHK